MRQSWFRKTWAKIGMLASLALCVVASASTPVSAETHRLVGNSRVVYVSSDGGNALLTSGPKRVNKATYDRGRDASAAGVAFKAAPFNDIYFNGQGQIGYSDGVVRAIFHTHDNSVPCSFTTCDEYVDGDSHAVWTGYTPWDADSMHQNDTIHVSGCAMSVSIPPGVGFTGGGDKAIWDSGWTGATWFIDHYFNNVHFWTNCGDWGIDQVTLADARFGVSTFVTTQANGQHSIP